MVNPNILQILENQDYIELERLHPHLFGIEGKMKKNVPNYQKSTAASKANQTETETKKAVVVDKKKYTRRGAIPLDDKKVKEMVRAVSQGALVAPPAGKSTSSESEGSDEDDKKGGPRISKRASVRPSARMSKIQQRQSMRSTTVTFGIAAVDESGSESLVPDIAQLREQLRADAEAKPFGSINPNTGKPTFKYYARLVL